MAPPRNVKKEMCVVYETHVKKSDIMETKCSITRYFYKQCLWQAQITFTDSRLRKDTGVALQAFRKGDNIR